MKLFPFILLAGSLIYSLSGCQSLTGSYSFDSEFGSGTINLKKTSNAMLPPVNGVQITENK